MLCFSLCPLEHSGTHSESTGVTCSCPIVTRGVNVSEGALGKDREPSLLILRGLILFRLSGLDLSFLVGPHLSIIDITSNYLIKWYGLTVSTVKSSTKIRRLVPNPHRGHLCDFFSRNTPRTLSRNDWYLSVTSSQEWGLMDCLTDTAHWGNFQIIL